MTSPLLRPPDWTRSAACDGHPLGPTAWDHCTPAARRICATCPVRHPCAIDALTTATPTGLWGGLTPDDRARIAADHDDFDRPGTPRHGTRSRYGHRTHPCRCDLCTEAMRRWKADYVARRPAATSPRKMAS